MSQEQMTPGGKLAHTVYFTLTDASSERIEELISTCQHFLSGHPGTDYFAAGTLVPDLQRPVNDRPGRPPVDPVFSGSR